MEIMGFVIWVICGLLFVGIGIYDYRSKKQVGFWANFDVPEVEDVIGFNKAVGRLFIIYGVVFILIGIPLIPSIFYKNILWCLFLLLVLFLKQFGLWSILL